MDKRYIADDVEDFATVDREFNDEGKNARTESMNMGRIEHMSKDEYQRVVKAAEILMMIRGIIEASER